MSRARPLVLLLLLVLALVPSAAASGTTGLVVGQIFGGGGNAGAPYANDYVELFNRGSSAVSLSGWSIQYATGSGSSWSVTSLAGSIPAGGSYLVQFAGGTTGSALPAPDATGTTNLAATSGKIALVRSGTALTCGATAGSCSSTALVEDLVGYGTASDYEGSGPAPGLSATTAAVRAGGGCTDADVNATDFSAAAPAPRNSAATPQPCAVTPPPPAGGPSANAAVEVEIEPVLSISLERATLNFGKTTGSTAPAPLSQRVSVLNNSPAGYTLTVGRSLFTPSDLPLALQATAPANGQIAPPFASGAFVGIPAAPASAITVGTTASTSGSEADRWETNVGFLPSFPAAAPGRYTATVTFTVIGR
jgi:hypothetical protein